MRKAKITTFQDFLDQLENLDVIGYEINLFRGQATNETLLPSICRHNSQFDSTEKEIEMLADFRRRSPLLITKNFATDWELLVFAQHFGLKTRLLDWTSNPLVALWFACQNQHHINENSYLYILSCDKDMCVDLEKNKSPFENENTRILRPTLNNERIVAQSGWFTAHKYSKTAKRFVTLETNTKMKRLLLEIEIPANLKKEILRKLSRFGVNNRTMFPDIIGLSLHLNWKYFEEHY